MDYDDWAGMDTEMDCGPETDSDDDEDEIRQLDAALEEADIELCDDSVDKDWTNCPSTSQTESSSHSVAQSSILSPTQELSKIDATLAINKLYDEKIRRLERILTTRLSECRNKLIEIQQDGVPEKQEVFRYINCGRPYFRDRSNFPAPENEDAIMAKNQMYDFSLVTSVPGWTVRDKNQFTQVMTRISLDLRKEEYTKKIKELMYLPDKQKVKKEIAALTKAKDALSLKMPFIELALPLDYEYDWELLSYKLNRRHTPHEYQCLWKLYFHPSINKSTWKSTEHNMLQSLASAHRYQDWDKIAKDLNTGRTGYQCFVYYRTNMTSGCIGKKWTHEEITYLRRLIEYFREDYYIPWGKIAAAMENRTKIQIYNKYMRLLEHRKGRFLPEEDAVILNCVKRFGPNFHRITQYLAHRSRIQIRARYQVLSKMRVSIVWSIEDDRKLIQIMTNQDSMTFAMATKFFPGRTRTNIRTRYLTLLRWIKRHPNKDIKFAPRRGARRLNHGQACEDLTKAIEDLKNSLKTEVSSKTESKKITKDSNECDIEDAIVAVLVNEAVKEREMKLCTIDNDITLPNEIVVSHKDLNLTNLHKCLIFLGANLNKDLYDKSHFKDDYPRLGDNSQDVSLFKVKSYSKKNKIKTIQMTDVPSIWGDSSLGHRNYVLPPHYATITGCKAIMSHVTSLSMYNSSVNLHVLVRRNPVLKEHMDQLLECFYSLFLWPLLLSNEGPIEIREAHLRKKDSAFLRPPALPVAPEVTINFDKYRKYQANGEEDIDLNEKTSRKKVITIEEPEGCSSKSSSSLLNSKADEMFE